MTFNFEIPKLVKELKKRKPKKVLVQLPEGVKQNVFEIVSEIEKLGIEVVVSGETCWGGCSVSVDEARNVKADLIVHFGHAEFTKINYPVLYVEVRDDLDLIPLMKKSLKEIKNFKTIGLSYSVQHKQDIKEIIKFYETNGKKVLLSEKLGHAAYPGHVVGCEYSGLKTIQNKVDCFLVIGNNFHSLGAALAVPTKKVFLLDVYNDEISEMSAFRDKITKQRIVSIEKMKEAKNVGVIVETKVAQKFGSEKYIIKKLKDAGKKVVLISMSEFTPDKIMNFYYIDAFIELACPRIAVDDFAKYNKPILTFREALVATGNLSYEKFLEQGIV